METYSAADRSKLGLAFVLAVGPSPWWGAERGEATDWFVVAGAAWLTVPIIAFAMTGAGGAVGWSALLIGGAFVFVGPIVVWAVTRRWLFGTNAFVVLPVRLAGAVAIAVGLDRGGKPAIVGLCLLGILAGCEASLSLRAVGVQLGVFRAAWWFLRSPLNVGVVLGLTIVMLVVGDDAIGTAFGLYASLWLMLAIMAGVVVTLQAADHVMVHERHLAEQAVRERERRERAHWIHDDVCAELRTVRLRLDAEVLAARDVARELSDLDHRLRLRQLDEQMDSGMVRLAEVVQPFVRMLQDRGIELSEVPMFDSANVMLDPATATLVRRAVSVLSSNALNAGATRVGLRANVTPGTVSVEVDDDAGGFRLEEIPAGRGLDSLRHQVSALAVDVCDDVTTVRVDVPRQRAVARRSRLMRRDAAR